MQWTEGCVKVSAPFCRGNVDLITEQGGHFPGHFPDNPTYGFVTRHYFMTRLNDFFREKVSRSIWSVHKNGSLGLFHFRS